MADRKIFRNGKVVLPDRMLEADLVVEGERIAGLCDRAEVHDGDEEIDAKGSILLPGLIDTHVHMWDPSPLNYREDWLCGSKAAAAGGITTICDMPLSVPPVTDETGFRLKLETADRTSCVDFAFWGGLTPACVGNMDELDRLGCIAYKGFMSFANPDYPQITDGYLVEGMKRAARLDALIGVHAENAEVADFGSRAMAESGCQDPAMHDEARPWWAELEAIQRATLFAKATGARLYICHMTIPEGADYLRRAKLDGVDVTVETCPHYLFFDRNALREKGAYAKCNPPLRTRERVEKLWAYVLDGTIDTLGSDHGPYADWEKTKEGNFFKEYSGFGGYDAMLPGLITEGVHKRGMTYPRLAALTSANAARVMGLFPRKGSLLPGSDADVVMVDPLREWVFDGTKSFSKTHTDKNVYHGARFKGAVQRTYVRGMLVYDGQNITAPPGHGVYIPKTR